MFRLNKRILISYLREFFLYKERDAEYLIKIMNKTQKKFRKVLKFVMKERDAEYLIKIMNKTQKKFRKVLKFVQSI